VLTKDFLCKREVLGKRSPHSFTPPSKCGRCVQQRLPYCTKLELKKQNMYIHDIPTISYLEERGTLGIGRFLMEPFNVWKNMCMYRMLMSS
jgi:hypothetical protein